MRGPTTITTIITTAVSPRGARNSKSSTDDLLGRAARETHNFNVVGKMNEQRRKSSHEAPNYQLGLVPPIHLNSSSSSTTLLGHARGVTISNVKCVSFRMAFGQPSCSIQTAQMIDDADDGDAPSKPLHPNRPNDRR